MFLFGDGQIIDPKLVRHDKQPVDRLDQGIGVHNVFARTSRRRVCSALNRRLWRAFAYSHISRLWDTSRARNIAPALLRVSSYSREGTESATTPAPAWK